MVQIVVVCLILFLAGYLFSKENIFSPTTIVSAVWLVTGAVFLFITSFHEPVSSRFTINMLLWIVCFSIASLSIQSFSFYVPYKDILPNRSIRNLYLLICIITLPILLYDVYQIVTTYSGGNIYSALRNANVRGDKALGMESTSRFFVVFWIVSYTLELICASKKNVWRIVFLLALNIFFAFISMGKTNMLVLFMITATILLFKKKISIKKIGIGMAVLFILFVGLQSIRSTKMNSYSNKMERFVSLYLISGITAFDDYVEPNSAKHWGENSFRLYYAVSNKFGVSNVEPVRPILKFEKVTINKQKYDTNVYTVLYPFYKDFGTVGVVVFALLTGLIFGLLFKLAQLGDNFALSLYAIYVTCLIVQFMGDGFYTIMSQNLQYLIFTYIPFAFQKLKRAN